MNTRLKFKFTRSRRIVEAGELTVDVENLTEADIAEKLKQLDFSSFIVVAVEPAAPDKWNFIPVTVDVNDKPTPRRA